MMRTLFAAGTFCLASISGGAYAQERATATFAGGCFWCVESDFDSIPGVVETVSGYTGGIPPNPTYELVSAGGTGHREAVQITYDPSRVAYADLLTAFWHSVDPTVRKSGLAAEGTRRACAGQCPGFRITRQQWASNATTS